VSLNDKHGNEREGGWGVRKWDENEREGESNLNYIGACQTNPLNPLDI